MVYSRTMRARWFAGGAMASALLLSGCADGIDLNGKVFDWLGVSPAAQQERKREPKLAERAPLVVPPDVNRLPEPGSGTEPGSLAWPNDPEQRKVREAQERQRLHMAYCRGEIQWKERALNKDSDTTPRSPYGPCPSLFGNITGSVNKD